MPRLGIPRPQRASSMLGNAKLAPKSLTQPYGPGEALSAFRDPGPATGETPAPGVHARVPIAAAISSWLHATYRSVVDTDECPRSICTARMFRLRANVWEAIRCLSV